MEEETPQQNQREEKGDSSEVLLHTLTVMNVSDHHTRVRISSQKENGVRVIGGLIGKQKGREIEIHSSYELVYSEVDGQLIVDTSYLLEKSNQLAEVFPSFDLFVGWYTTGPGIRSSDVLIHRQFLEVNENPIVMVLDPDPQTAVKNQSLPVYFYESETRLVDGIPTMKMTPLSYKIVTEESERVAVDHVCHSTLNPATAQSSLYLHLSPVGKAVQMLDQRLMVIQAYLLAVKSGDLPKNREILRQISCLCGTLPITNSPDFNHQFQTEFNDTLLVAYLAALTKGAAYVDDLASKFNKANESKRKRPRGMFV